MLSVIYAAQLICGQDRGGGGSVRRLPVTRSRVVPTQDLGRSTRMSACFVGPDKIARETSREREIEREGGERAGNAIKCPLPGVEIGGTWLDCGFSLPEARCWCDYCDGLRCCFIFFISYVCIIDDNDDEPDNNGDASGHGRWAAQRRRPFAYLANNNNGQRQWPKCGRQPRLQSQLRHTYRRMLSLQQAWHQHWVPKAMPRLMPHAFHMIVLIALHIMEYKFPISDASSALGSQRLIENIQYI